MYMPCSTGFLLPGSACTTVGKGHGHAHNMCTSRTPSPSRALARAKCNMQALMRSLYIYPRLFA
jgi:hypothetical protein